MANSLQTNPIVIDSSVTSYKSLVAASLGTLFTLKIERIRWVNPTVAGQQIFIGDPASGDTLLAITATAAGQDVDVDWTANPRIWRDFSIDIIPSGTKLYVYTR